MCCLIFEAIKVRLTGILLCRGISVANVIEVFLKIKSKKTNFF